MIARLPASVHRYLERVPRRHRRPVPNLPSAMTTDHAVLGVDVGFSTIRASSAVCRLEWNENTVAWTIERFRATPAEQERALCAIGGDVRLQAAALDGPLRSGFDVIGAYRPAERMLTRRLQSKIGKPGQSSAPIGKSLNAAANACAQIIRTRLDIAPAGHAKRIDALAVVEAFPSSFMGVLVDDPEHVPNRRADRTDVFYEHLVETGGFDRLLAHLLPGRVPVAASSEITNHDDRMALVCALTALAVATDDYVAVGDDREGWIILPPRVLMRDWAWQDLEANAAAELTGTLFTSTTKGF